MILIIDFGSQFNQLIARRVRECRVYCQIEPPSITCDHVKALNPEGIILSGGPSSIYEPNSPKIDPAILGLGIPVLGICYGLQYMVHTLGGSVARSSKREYGFAEFQLKKGDGLFKGVEAQTNCWMSHGDSITKLPSGFRITGSTENTRIAAASNPRRKMFGLQFHPEVEHTPRCKRMLRNFLSDICGCRMSWNMKSFASQTIDEIRHRVGDKKVILGLSGGVDSSVAALLIHQAIGKNLTCIFVDNGLLRKNEAEQLKIVFKENLKINIRVVKASGLSLIHI